MSSQNTPFIKTKRLSATIAMAVLGSSTSAYAVNFGQTNIQSAQYEPLYATIAVNDIDKNDFNVSLANRAIYQQMGLTPNQNIKATFQRTSPTSGKIVLRSSQPINEPFADLVLDVKNSDKKQFMPKTLLMPVGKNAAVNAKPQTVVATATTPELPKVTATPKVVEAKPRVAASTKPSLPTATAPKATVTNNTPTGIPDGEFAEATRQAFLASQANKQPLQEKATSKKTDNKVETAQLNAKKSEKVKKPAVDAKQNPKKLPPQPKPQKREAVAKNKTTKTVPNVVAKVNEPPIGEVKSDVLLLKEIQEKNLISKDKKATKKVSKPKVKQRQNQKAKKRATHKKSTGKPTYVVQKNDNLWSIALEISKRNKVNVHTVMKQIQQNNPHAFAHGKADQLLANKTLVLPEYEVVPSQKSLQAAVHSKKSAKKSSKYSAKAKSKHRKKSKTKARKSTKHTKYQAKSRPKKTRKPVVRKPKVSLVAPSTVKNTNKKTANGSANNSQLVAMLKKKRQVAAKHASTVQQLNGKVSSYSQKLKLQNKKLAELEARLKKLKGQD